jgi:predicted ATPase/serine/threonine protein kinase/Tfp pilus assembly protein PilF
VEQFGKFELQRRLGAGGMGEVFLAREKGRQESVVVKRILPHLVSNARFLRLFLDETRIAARLDHPNIARILELGEAGETWFVSMEYVQGSDLREVLRRAREAEALIPLEVSLEIARQVGRALTAAHGARDAQGRALKIVHRDVSPHNILLSRNGKVKLIDFGVARASNKALHTATGILKGKFPYMAPEQASAKKVDHRTDVFSLGIVLWEMICGMHLFRGKSDAATLKLVRACEVTPPSQLVDRLPQWVDALVMKALEAQPKDRYKSAAAFVEALDTRLAGLPAADIGAVVRLYDRETPSRAFLSLTDEPETIPEAESRETLNVKVAPRADGLPMGPRTHERMQRTLALLNELSARPTNLASQATSFVGRVAELADLHQLFRGGARLITLLGPGGTGKTRLSIQFGQQLVSHFGTSERGPRRGGVWFCELADARDADGICVGVARAVGVQLAPGDHVQQLGHALAARGETLLLLDNFEQAVESAQATLERWLQLAPQVRFVVSSREQLKISHEVVFEVPPLRLPDRVEDTRTSEAVQLFIERARLARPGWELSPKDEADVAEVVKQLDGMPLAIELAAARMALLSPAQLVQRLPRRFELLKGTAANTGPDRQGTLRGAIDWSWTLLKPWEQVALAQCSVFRGGFTPEAAEAVVSLEGQADAPEVLEVLLTLRSKSLVRGYYPPEAAGELRYGLFETIREYALEHLQSQGSAAAARERHAKFFIAVGKRLSMDAEGDPAVLDALALERENLNAVFQHAVESGHRGARALQAVLALDPLLSVRGPFGPHLAMLNAAMSMLGEQDRAHKLHGLEARGRVRQLRGKVAEAALDFQEMLTIAQSQGVRELEGRALLYLANIERVRANRGEARRLYERALETLRQVGDRRYEGRTLANLGTLLQEMGQEDQAMTCYLDGLAIHRALGDRRIEGVTLGNLGVLQQNRGKHAEARENYEAALEIHREMGNRRGEGIGHINLGDLHRDLEEAPQSKAHYQRALAILSDGGFRRFEGLTLVSLGALHQQLGELDDAKENLREGLRALAETGDRRYEGLARAALAAAEATQGNLDAAEIELGHATSLLTQANDLNFLEALDLYRAHLELAQALRAPTDHIADELENRISRRVVRAETPQPPDETHPGGVSSPVERSEQVRAALRSLKDALRRASAERR